MLRMCVYDYTCIHTGLRRGMYADSSATQGLGFVEGRLLDSRQGMLIA